jgi:ADP-ribose pyrophosphatase YjhB (NUDIX family)
MKSFTRFSFCPACASPRIRVHQKNAIRCSACGYVYFHNCAAAVAAIVEIGDKILLVKRAHDPQKGLFDLPGGFVDYKESLETAIVREVREECGIEVTDLRYFGSFPNTYVYRDVTYFTADAFFICKAADAKKLRVSEETSELKVIAPDAMDDGMIAFDSVRNVLRKYGQQRRAK